MSPSHDSTARRRLQTVLPLTLILALTACLHFWRIDSSPPGLHADEASTVWNSYCLLKTGHDEWGKAWPIFYTRGLDDYRSTLYMYLLLPFQAVDGMNIFTARLPVALGAVGSVALIYLLGRRLFDRPTGLLAALLLALSPWHLQQTRFAFDGALSPLLVAASLVALLWAGAPVVDSPRRFHPARALLAGLLMGIACYGYPAFRIFLPITLLLIFVATLQRWREALQDRASRRAFTFLILGLALPLVPLLWKHLSDPLINHRGQELVLSSTTAPDSAPPNIFIRYISHFSLTFLFAQASTDPLFAAPQGYGSFSLYMLPLLASGIGAAISRGYRSAPARLLLVLLIAYPTGDILFGGGEPHPLRSFPGIIGLCLLAAYGAVVVVGWITTHSFVLARSVVVALGLWITISSAIFVNRLFDSFHTNPEQYWVRHVDLMQACQWLEPKLPNIDVVYCTRQWLMIPYAPLLVHLNYDPAQWFADAKSYAPGPPPLDTRNTCVAFGKIKLIVDPQATHDELEAMKSDAKPQRVAMILRPDQAALAGDHKPSAEIRFGGQTWLLLYEFEN